MNEEDVQNLINAARLANFNIKIGYFEIVNWLAGEDTHIPTPLPPNKMAVYTFFHGDLCLKVGMVNTGSSARYQSQHYGFNAPSTLAKSLIVNENYYLNGIGNNDVGLWMRQNLDRYNLLINAHLGKYFLQFAEGFFILKFKPLFERR